MVSNVERSEATRAALVRVATELFAVHGYADTSVEAVVQAAGVSRGALYHHFRDKASLFRAVHESLEERMVAAVAAEVAGEREPFAILRRGAEAFLDACLDPALQRIVLLEAPAVLGWETWREIDQAYGLGLVRSALELAQSAGAIRPGPTEPLAHILLGGLVEAAMLLAGSQDQDAARREVGEAIALLLDGLRSPPGGTTPGRRRRARRSGAGEPGP